MTAVRKAGRVEECFKSMRDFSDAGKDPELLKQKKEAEKAARAEKRRKEAEAYEADTPDRAAEAQKEVRPETVAEMQISIEDAIADAVAEAAEKESRMDEKRRRREDPRRRRRRRITAAAVCGTLGICIAVLTCWLWPRAPGGITLPPPSGGSSVTDPSGGNIPGSLQEQISGENAQRKGVYTFLLGGTDEDGSRTDVLMTLTLDTVNGSIKMLSIPRDSMVRGNTSTGVRKINSAYGTKTGIEATREAVARITGYYANRYVIVDLDGFVELIDAVGGVWYDVPQDMKYTDPTQDLYIDLKKGYQLLDGKKAIQLVRFRKGYYNQDLGRIETTQGFLKALFSTLVQPKNITKIQHFAKLLTEHTETDLTVSELVWLATQAAKIDSEKIETFTAPGSSRNVYGASYIVLKEKELLEIVNEHMNPLTKPISDLDIVTGGTLTPKPTATPSVPDVEIPTVTTTPEPEVSVTPEADPTEAATPSPEPTPAEVTPEPENSPTPTPDPLSY